MKSKNLYILAIGIVSLLIIIVLVVVPFLISFKHIWIAISIVLALIVGGFILYVVNMPGGRRQKFYDHEPVKKLPDFQGHRFSYRKAKYPFSCGQAALSMLLEKYGIFMKQDEILALSGDKTLGATAQELRDTLNTIFKQRNAPFIARIRICTNQLELSEAIEKKFGVIVMFINQFHEPGYPKYASYPHFALVNHVSIDKNSIILTNPSYSTEKNPNFTSGKFEGEIKMSLHPEFQDRFYISGKNLNRLRYKPTHTSNVWLNTWNRVINFLFIFSMTVGYCITILKPGLAIFVEPIQEE